jgi:hypothetical protein
VLIRDTENQIQRYVLNIPREKKRCTQQRYTDEQIQRYMLGTCREKRGVHNTEIQMDRWRDTCY